MKKKMGEQRKGEEKKEENETVTVTRRCEGFASVEAFEIFSQGGDLESYGDHSWEDPLEKLDDLSECELVSCELVRVVADVSDVIDVAGFPSSVITELCVMFPRCALIGKLWKPQPFSLFQKTCTLVYRYAGRDEVRRLTSDHASASEKKDDAAYTCAKFVGSRQVTKRKAECERKNNHRKDQTVFGKKSQCEGEG